MRRTVLPVLDDAGQVVVDDTAAQRSPSVTVPLI